MERIFGLLRSGYRSLALAGVIALGLAGASIPDARAADGRFYVGLNVPVMFIDDTESTTTGAQALNIQCSAPGSLDTSLSHAAGLIEIAACHA